MKSPEAKLKNNLKDNLKIKRISSSPYYKPQFIKNEHLALSEFGDVLSSSDENTSPNVLITNTHTNFDLISDEICDQLKLVIHPNSGYDNVTLDFVRRINAPIIIGNTIRSHAVTHYILAALFSHYSQVPKTTYWDSERKWKRKLLNETKVVLIGYGHIGKLLSQILAPLVKNLSIYDPFQQKTELDIKNADTVILACGLNSKSRHLIDKVFLNQISENALIINAARGECIKTSDLVTYLKSNSEAYAVLDVFEKEPCDFSIFRDLKNISLTSHIAGVFSNIDEATITFEAQVLNDFLSMTDFDFQNKYQKMILQNKIHPSLGIL